MVFILALLASLIAGMTGLLNTATLNWWRWRLHGISLLLIWALLPADLVGPRMLLMLISVIALEVSFLPFSSALQGDQILPAGDGILDSQAALRRIAIVDCSCSGACTITDQYAGSACMAKHTSQAL